MNTTTPVTGEIKARRLLADELEKRSPNGKFLVPTSQVELFDAVTDAAAAIIERQQRYIQLHAGDCLSLDNEVQTMRREIESLQALDRASGDGVRVTDEMVEAACKAFSPHQEYHWPTAMRAAIRAALSAVSIPRGGVVTDEMVTVISAAYDSVISVFPFSNRVYQGALRSALEDWFSSHPLPPAGGWRDIAIEECAAWHDREASNNAQDDNYAAVHIVSARALRSLKSPATASDKE